MDPSMRHFVSSHAWGVPRNQALPHEKLFLCFSKTKVWTGSVFASRDGIMSWRLAAAGGQLVPGRQPASFRRIFSLNNLSWGTFRFIREAQERTTGGYEYSMPERTREDKRGFARKGLLLVEVISEGPHCVPCQYAIAAVKYVWESYKGRIEFKIVETKKLEDAARYFDLCHINGRPIPVPAIVVSGRLVFDRVPGPEELCQALDAALLEWESNVD